MPVRIAYVVTALVAAIAACLTPRASAVGGGGKIVFATNRAPNLYRGALYSIRPDGAGRRREGLFAPGATESMLSPDRRRMLFARYFPDGIAALYVTARAGAPSRRLTPPGMSVHYGFFGGMAFSPDGTRVAFAARTPCDASDCGPWGLYVVRIDGTRLRRIVQNAVEPSWSSDGRKLAYRNFERGRVFVVRLRDRRVWGLGRGSGAVWAPRGDLLAFSAVRGRAVCFVRPESASRRCVAGDSTDKLMWSRDGRWLAFQESSGGELGVVKSNGRGLRVFSHGPETSVPAAWSPDGRRIAYVYGADDGRADSRPGYELYVRSVIGRSVPRRVTREPDGTWLGQVFWDDGRIRYVAHRYRNDFELAVINPDGTGLELLTRNELSEIDPTWSADGESILFARGRLHTMSATGVDVRPVTESGAWTDTNPAWSPSGDRIAFVRTAACYRSCLPPGTLMIRDAAGRERGVAKSVSQARVSWSPDGRFLAFSTELGLRVLDSATGHIRRLETGLESSHAPAWSPDGEQIAFAALGQVTPRRRLDLFTIRPDGSARTLIAEDVGAGGSWSPDGRRIVFARPVPQDFVTQLVVVNLDGGQETVLTRNYSANLAPDWSR